MPASRCPYAPALVAVAVVVGGCAAPVQYFNGTKPTIPAANMPLALTYLNDLRSQYQTTVTTQMRDERYLTNSLVGAGAVALGLALGHVNTNAITGVALGAGTAYTLGNINLSRQPVLVYLAGIDALNCAEKAVLPLYISATDMDKLPDLLDGKDGLGVRRGRLAAALVAGEVILAGASQSTSKRRLEAALAAGTKVFDASTATMQAGRDFIALSARGSRELVATVTGIDTAVARAIVTATPDLSAVPGLVAGLAGTAGSFVPGAGIDAATLDKLRGKPSGGTEAAPPAPGAGVRAPLPPPDPIETAANDVLDAAKAVAEANTQVRSLLPSGPVLWPEDAFKNCGVAQVVSALSASTTALRFAAGVDAQQEFEIHGGVKPYFVRFDGPTADGLSVKSPVRFDNLSTVNVTGSKVTRPLETQLRVVDSSPTPRLLSIPVSITASGSGSGAQSPGDDAVKLGQVASFKIDGRTFAMQGQPVDDGTSVSVTVQCPGGDVKLARSALGAALLKAAGITQPKRQLKIATVPLACATD